jgi:hypothetical protein
MFEVISDPTAQVPVDERDRRRRGGLVVDAARLRILVDWPGASFWRELSAANPDALVLLSVRDPEGWYRSASNSIFLIFEAVPPELRSWFESMLRLLGERFSDRLDHPTAMMDAFERHNAAVRKEIPSQRLLEWTPTDGWEPICERLSLDVPNEPFPKTNELTIGERTLECRRSHRSSPLRPAGHSAS